MKQTTQSCADVAFVMYGKELEGFIVEQTERYKTDLTHCEIILRNDQFTCLMRVYKTKK